MLEKKIISGENFQQLADIYLGARDDFLFNPVIMEQIEKHQVLEDICTLFDNPPIIFLYPHHLRVFTEKLKYFCNPFTLITHNSDVNIEAGNPFVQQILDCRLLKMWWAQNLCFIHPKMHFIPIGIANSMWEHGNPELYINNNTANKTHDIYNNYSIYTNVAERRECADAMESRASMLPMVTAKEHVERLAKYKYCLCPEGNGVDTHRLWEALLLGSIPIVKNTAFTRIIQHYTRGEIPMIIMDSWWDPVPNQWIQSKIIGSAKGLWLSMEYYTQLITNA
jgi:hypothetical protein